MKAAVYIRVSTEEQAKEGFSITAQREKLTAFAQSQSWSIQDFYIDEGFSAKNTERPQLQRLLTEVRKRSVDVVLVYRLDRLTRSVLDLYQLLQEFDRHHVKFRSCTEVYDTTTAIGRLFLTLVAALAQWERENLAERVKMGMGQMAREQKRPGGPSPYGYDLSEGKLTVNHREAEIVKLIFTKYLSGAGIQQIAAELNELGHRGKLGAPWNSTTLSHLLQNHAYYGALRWNYADAGKKQNPPEKWVIRENAHPPIIEKTTFSLAQKLLASRKLKHPREMASDFIFSGVLFCSKCSSSMHGKTGKTKKKNGKVYINRYYLCKKGKSKECSACAIREDLLETAFLQQLPSLFTDSSLANEVYRKQKDQPSAIPLIQLQKNRLEQKRLRLEEAYAEGVFSLERYRHKIAEIDQQRDALCQQLEQSGPWNAAKEKQFFSHLLDIKLIWEYAAQREKKHLVSLLVKRIEAEADLSDSNRSTMIYRPVLMKRICFH